MQTQPDGFAAARERMVAEQLVARGLRDAAVLAAFRAVPREEFVVAEQREHAYEDRPLPIDCGQTISQPYIVARMLELVRLQPHERALEIGAGSGYAAALLALVAREVDAVERHAELARDCAERLARLGYANVRVHHGDGTLGWPAQAPYDAIVVAAAARRVPRALRLQLGAGGRLVMPVGGRTQRLRLLVRDAQDGFEREDLEGVQFVPLIGEGA